jgi:hypothetical protein
VLRKALSGLPASTLKGRFTIELNAATGRKGDLANNRYLADALSNTMWSEEMNPSNVIFAAK